MTNEELMDHIKLLINQCQIEIKNAMDMKWDDDYIMFRQGAINAYRNILNMLRRTK